MDLTISVDSLLKLPEGAAYRESHDRAHVEARQRDGVIYITGTCDSLERQVEYYATLYHTARDALESYRESVKEETKARESPLKIFVKGLALGFVAGISLTYFIKYSRRRKNE